MIRIKELREEKGLQQHDIAKLINRTAACISSWETEKTEPSIEDLKQLSLILDTTIDYLVGLSDEQESAKESLKSSPVLEKIVKLLKTLKTEDQYQVLGFVQALNK